jgi:diguanylate cyclase (GGDEF)-like protein
MPRGAVILIAFVIVAGAAALAAAAAAAGFGPGFPVAVVALLAAAVVAGEFAGIKVRLQGEEGEVTPSTTFAFALLLVAGAAGAVIVVGACVLADALRRKPPVKVAFNAGQYALSLGAAVLVLRLAGVPAATEPHFAPGDLPVVVLAAVAFFVLNSMLVAAVIALLERENVWAYFSRDFVFQASSAGLLLGLSPIVVLGADFSVFVLPLLALPLLAIVQGQRQAVVNEHQALHDALTGLPNRVLFGERVAYAARAAARDGTIAAVMVMDLDRFKGVNDTLGHHNGDALLREVGERLREILPERATVARLGGDEFAVLTPLIPRTEDVERIAEHISIALARPLQVAGMELVVGASIGVACAPAHGRTAEALMQHADIAMYWAKRRRLGHATYAPEQDEQTPTRIELASELRRAVTRGELVPHFQPKIDIATGEVEGLEALLRWQHPERGLIPPVDFIPVAEHTGLIGPTTLRVIEQSLGHVHRWRRLGLDVHVGVNLSARMLLDRRLPHEIGRLLEAGDAPPRALQLEITESMLMADAERAASILGELSAMGVSIAIDDFGTGYSSLAYLRRLPVDTIKIDRSFVMGMTERRSDAAIVRSTIDLAHNLGLRVVAEGVEDEATGAELARLGCDVVQGFAISRAQPAADIERWMLERRSSGAAPGVEAPAA